MGIIEAVLLLVFVILGYIALTAIYLAGVAYFIIKFCVDEEEK